MLSRVQNGACQHPVETRLHEPCHESPVSSLSPVSVRHDKERKKRTPESIIRNAPNSVSHWDIKCPELVLNPLSLSSSPPSPHSLFTLQSSHSPLNLISASLSRLFNHSTHHAFHRHRRFGCSRHGYWSQRLGSGRQRCLDCQ